MPNPTSDIVELTYSLLKQVPAFKAAKKGLTYPTKDEECPIACVAYGPDRADSEGNFNQGAPHFLHTFTLLVSIIDRQDNSDDLEDSIVNLAGAVRTALLNYDPWIRMFEGIDSMQTQVVYPRDAEMPLVEIRMSFDVKFRSDWEPTEVNLFREIVIYRQLSTTEMDGAPPGTFGPEPLKDDEIIQ